MRKLGIAGCKHTTKDLIEALLEEGFTIDIVITISPSKARDQKVAGYLDLRPYLEEKGISYYIAEKYSLKSDQDKEHIKALDLDILLCMGWQRLIPEWLLDELSVGAFGMHGSNKPLPHGRGRSPLNWSIILDKEVFFTHLFRYDPGVDSGDVIGYQIFDITNYDTALTLHYKNLLSMISLCKNHLPMLLRGEVNAKPQPDVCPSYFPKRTEEDGIIHWDMSVKDIYNLIRAVTKPFPGAFTFLPHLSQNKKIIIWRAMPFDSHIRWDDRPHGTILKIFHEGNFIVKCGDTSLLVTEYDGIDCSELKEGIRFHNNNIKRKGWTNIPH